MIPELVGRFGTIVEANPMTLPVLESILDAKDSPLDDYVEFFRKHDIAFEFTEDAKQEVAARALKLGIGARGLAQVLILSRELNKSQI